MKKLISVFICAIMVLSLLPFTASAADEINFTLRLKSETDNEVVLALDYDGGTGFCALDADITYDRVRLELKSCEKGDGYVAFEKFLDDEGSSSIASINSKINPIKVSMANLLSFRSVGGKKSVITLKFAKVPGTKFAKNDVTVDFTNCQTETFTDIKVNFAYDLKQSVSVVDKTDATEGSTEYPQQPSEDNVEGENDSEIGDTPVTDENNKPVEQENQEQTGGDSNGADDTTTTGTTPDNSKTIIIIVAVAVVALGAGTVVIVKVKGKKKND